MQVCGSSSKDVKASTNDLSTFPSKLAPDRFWPTAHCRDRSHVCNQIRTPTVTGHFGGVEEKRSGGSLPPPHACHRQDLLVWKERKEIPAQNHWFVRSSSRRLRLCVSSSCDRQVGGKVWFTTAWNPSLSRPPVGVLHGHPLPFFFRVYSWKPGIRGAGLYPSDVRMSKTLSFSIGAVVDESTVAHGSRKPGTTLGTTLVHWRFHRGLQLGHPSPLAWAWRSTVFGHVRAWQLTPWLARPEGQRVRAPRLGAELRLLLLLRDLRETATSGQWKAHPIRRKDPSFRRIEADTTAEPFMRFNCSPPHWVKFQMPPAKKSRRTRPVNSGDRRKSMNHCHRELAVGRIEAELPLSTQKPK